MSGVEIQDQLDMSSWLDAEAACEYSHHVGEMPASLAVVYFRVAPCGCIRERTLVLFCDPCWEFRNFLGRVRCPDCDENYPCLDPVRRVERI